MRNSLPLALIGGLISALIGAAIWTAVTLSTGYQIGWMAVGVGFLVGFAVRIFGQGSEPVFGVIGAIFALLGCVLGNLFSGIGFIAQEFDVEFFDALTSFDYSASFELLSEMFSPMDLLFYGIAIYEGFKFGTVEP